MLCGHGVRPPNSTDSATSCLTGPYLTIPSSHSSTCNGTTSGWYGFYWLQWLGVTVLLFDTVTVLLI
jgi:hypothetical protein